LFRAPKTKRERIRIKYPSVSTVTRIIRYLKDIGGDKRLKVSFYARSGRVVVRRKRYKNFLVEVQGILWRSLIQYFLNRQVKDKTPW